MKQSIHIKIPRTGSTSLDHFCNGAGILYFGGMDMGFWGSSQYNISTPTSTKLAECVKDHVGQDLYLTSFKFSTVRNPWDRAVSMWLHGPSCWHPDLVTTFKEFCQLLQKDKYPSPCARWHSQPFYKHLFNENGECLIDFIIRLETIQQDCNTICDRLGIDHRQIPHVNKSNRKHYTEYYDDETREIVADKFKEDIDHFGYKFGQ